MCYNNKKKLITNNLRSHGPPLNSTIILISYITTIRVPNPTTKIAQNNINVLQQTKVAKHQNHFNNIIIYMLKVLPVSKNSKIYSCNAYNQRIQRNNILLPAKNMNLTTMSDESTMVPVSK